MADSSEEDPFTRDRIEAVLAAFEDGDVVAPSEMYAEDGVFIDPHYPEPEYRGPEEIREALEWALENVVEQPGFTVRKHEPAATSEVADEVGVTRQRADYRLRQLEDDGLVNSKIVGNSLVWFVADNAE